MPNSSEPTFLLCLPDDDLFAACATALQTHLPPTSLPRFKLINERLNALLGLSPPISSFDCIVSPANSYGRMDGSFDHSISLQFSPRSDYFALTRAVQAKLYEEWKGYAPPGTCTLVQIPEEIRGVNPFGCRYVACLPTMRTPEDVRWNKEVVYNCVWSLLVAVDRHNSRSVPAATRGLDPTAGEGEGQEESMIRTILMPGLGTRVGKISPERFANQYALACKHFEMAKNEPERWSKLEWVEIMRETEEVEVTHGL